jgi:hypothetical protein
MDKVEAPTWTAALNSALSSGITDAIREQRARAAAQKFGIDRADFVEHLAQFAEVGEELADFGVGRIRV